MGLATRLVSLAGVVFLAATWVTPVPARAGGASPGSVRLSLGDSCFSVRPTVRYVMVSLGYVRPGAGYSFVATLQNRTGFGGGNMGVHRADAHGVVHFAYPVPNHPQEVGWWTITASYQSRLVARASLLVMQGSCSPGPGVEPQKVMGAYFADIADHHYYAAYQLEAPCNIGFTTSNGPGAPPGSEGYSGRGPLSPNARTVAASRYTIIRSMRVTGIRQLHIPILEQHHILAFGVSGWFTFDYSHLPFANMKHKNGFHEVKIAVWQCNGRWGVDSTEWLMGSGGELTWI